MKKRIFVVFLTTVLMFGVFDVAYGETTENTVAAQSTSATIVDSCKCGDNVTYTLDSDGLLTISGSGYIYDFNYKESLFYNNDDIKKLL